MTETLRNLLASLALPPLLLLAMVVMLGLLGWRGRRGAALAAAGLAGLVILLATPLAAGLLAGSLDITGPSASVGTSATGAIVILGAEVARGATGPDIGPLTLERLRAGAALYRRLGLPVLVTGGPAAAGETSLAVLMAESLRVDFGVPVQWIEPAARDTRENAQLSAAILRADGISAAHLVTHAWHMPRAAVAFARSGLTVQAAPVRWPRLPDGRMSDMLPRPDHLAMSWLAIREWAGRLVYAMRDGG